MGLGHTIFNSFTEVPKSQWESLVTETSDLSFDPRLLEAMESKLRADYPFFTIVIHDDSSRALGIACSWLFPVDLKQFKWMRWLTTLLPLRISILFCGLPLPAGKNQLLIAPDADRVAVIAELIRALRRLAKERKASMI